MTIQLPEYTIHGPRGTGDYFSGHTDAAMKSYGEQCRKQALEDAAKICDDLQKWPSSECRHCAIDIRGLK